MREEIRKALDNASTDYEWDSDGSFIEWKDGHPLRGTYRRIAITNAHVSERFDNENHENDAHLIVNTPKYLEWCLSQLTEKDKQIAELGEALETAIMWFRGSEMHIKAEQLNKMLKSMGGDKRDN